MSVTLKQIADMAGVHKSTVDKVIHDRPGVSEAKREQIRALLEQYGYESNPLAKALNYQKKKLTVGILLAHTAASAALRRGIERVRQDFASFNIALDLRETESADTEQQAACLREFRESGAAGVIACTADDEAVKTALCALHDADIPLILVHSAPENVPCLCRIEQDVQQAGRTAARMLRLLLGGSGRVGVLRTPGGVTLQEQSLADAGVLTYGSNVKEVTTQVIEGAVDCGIIYATDAYSAGLESVDEATADMCGQVIYPAAVLRNSAHPDEAKAFLDYLTGEDAGKVFESVGFTPLA